VLEMTPIYDALRSASQHAADADADHATDAPATDADHATDAVPATDGPATDGPATDADHATDAGPRAELYLVPPTPDPTRPGAAPSEPAAFPMRVLSTPRTPPWQAGLQP
jgi:hypothetical protein